MAFIEDLAQYEAIIPRFQSYISSYYVSGMLSAWTMIDGRPVREDYAVSNLSTDIFSWERQSESLRVAIADFYREYVPGYPVSPNPKDLHYFFSGREFCLHMWDDVIGGRKNPAINGITLGGWTVFRDWLISEAPEEAALLGSLLHKRSNKGQHDLTDPLEYLRSLVASKDTYMLAGYALWRIQHTFEEYDLEAEDFEAEYPELGWY